MLARDLHYGPARQAMASDGIITKGLPVKFSQPMTIAYDLSPDSYRAAIAYRAMLEYYSHNVASVRLDSEESARSFLGHPPRAALTLLMCHG